MRYMTSNVLLISGTEDLLQCSRKPVEEEVEDRQGHEQAVFG